MIKGKSPKKRVIDKLGQVLDFGQYKGETVQWVLDNDPSYILWMDETGKFDLSTQILDLAYEKEDEDIFNHAMSDYLRGQDWRDYGFLDEEPH